MTRLQKGLLIGAVAFLLLVGACSTAFYFKVYKPFGAPMMAMAISQGFDEQLTEKNFIKPGSGDLTPEQVRRFVAVEEAIETGIGDGRASLAEQQRVLELADKNGALNLDSALASFGAIREILMSAKPRQIEIMKREHFSKKEFEWVRDQLYRAAALPLTRIDTSDFFTGASDPAIRIRTISSQEVTPANLALAGPIAKKLEAWRPLAFFGL